MESKIVLKLLGYLNEDQWIDALRNYSVDQVRSVLQDVEDHYDTEVVIKDKFRAKYNLDTRHITVTL